MEKIFFQCTFNCIFLLPTLNTQKTKNKKMKFYIVKPQIDTNAILSPGSLKHTVFNSFVSYRQLLLML